MKNSKHKNVACNWWSSLSMNDQEKYRKEHPYYKNFNSDYFWGLYPRSVIEVYDFLVENKLL